MDCSLGMHRNDDCLGMWIKSISSIESWNVRTGIGVYRN